MPQAHKKQIGKAKKNYYYNHAYCEMPHAIDIYFSIYDYCLFYGITS